MTLKQGEGDNRKNGASLTREAEEINKWLNHINDIICNLNERLPDQEFGTLFDQG